MACIDLARRTQRKPFRVSIQTASCYRVGDCVECEITISNNDDVDYYLFARETPLEGLRSHIFTVSRGRFRRPIPYDGIMLKRGPPTTKEWVPIKASSHLQRTVYLSEAYSFPATGKYTIQLKMKGIFRKEETEESTQTMVSNKVTFMLTGNRKLTLGEHACKEESHYKGPLVAIQDFQSSDTDSQQSYTSTDSDESSDGCQDKDSPSINKALFLY